MKRSRQFLLTAAAVLGLLPMAVLAQTLQEKTFVYTGARWASPNTNVATFWEAPSLSAGETRSGGTLALENTSDKEVTLTLSEAGLPYDNADAMAYLDALQLQILDGETELFNDQYSRLGTGDSPVLQTKLAPGEKKIYTISLSCSFRYTGQLEELPVISWTFDSENVNTSPVSKGPDMQLMALGASITGTAVFGILFIVLLVQYVRRKRTSH